MRLSIIIILFVTFYFVLFIILFINNFNFFKIAYIQTNINLSIISNSLLLFSCFYDKRYNSIRLIGSSSRIINLKCLLIYEYYNISCNYKYIRFKKDSSGNYFKNKYINIIIPLNSSKVIPSYLLINEVKYKVINGKGGDKKNIVCITTMKNFESYNLFKQTLDIFYIYGITDVYLYTSDDFLDLNKLVSRNRIKLNIIHILNDILLSSSFYFGQIVKQNDCLYRNMYNSNYIIFNDYDEIILLKRSKSYYSILKSFGKGDIFYIRSALCPTANNSENKHFHKIKDVNIKYTLRCCLMNSYYHRKYIIKSPYKFLKINIHYIDYIYKQTINIYVESNLAYIHHSRIPTFRLMNHCSIWFNDTSLKSVLNKY